MSRSLRGLSQEGVREALSRNPRLRWVAKTVLRPLIDRLLPQISAAQNENLLPKVEPILFHYMMVSLTATLSGFGTEMEVISNLSPGDSPSRRNLLTPFSDSQRSSAISTTAICSCLRLARFEIVSSRHSPRMIDNRRVGGLRLMRVASSILLAANRHRNAEAPGPPSDSRRSEGGASYGFRNLRPVKAIRLRRSRGNGGIDPAGRNCRASRRVPSSTGATPS